jgi:hypothetical protein
MPTETTNSRFTPETRRLIRSYGLLVLVAIAFIVMAMLVREKSTEVPVESIGYTTSAVTS